MSLREFASNREDFTLKLPKEDQGKVELKNCSAFEGTRLRPFPLPSSSRRRRRRESLPLLGPSRAASPPPSTRSSFSFPSLYLLDSSCKSCGRKSQSVARPSTPTRSRSGRTSRSAASILPLLSLAECQRRRSHTRLILIPGQGLL